MKRARTIDTVLFDLDDTLLEDAKAYKEAARQVARDVAAERGGDAETLYHAYVAQANQFWTKLSTEHMDRPIHDARTQLWSDALEASGVPFDLALAQRCSADYTRYRTANLALFPGVVEMLTELRALGCKIGVVTNGFSSTHNEKIDKAGLRPYVDTFFLADEMKMVKPDPEIFRFACRTLASEPANTAMVGDLYHRDIVGALEVGLFTVLVDVHATPLPEGARPPDAVVAAIADVLGVLPLGTRQGGG